MSENTGSQRTVIVHYNRLRGDYEGWTLWVWGCGPEPDGRAVPPVYFDDFGAVFELRFETRRPEGAAAGFLPRYKDWESKDRPERAFGPEVPAEIYLLEGDPSFGPGRPETSPRIISASLDGPGRVKLVFNRPVDGKFLSEQSLSAGDGKRSFRPPPSDTLGLPYGRTAVLPFDGLGLPDIIALNSGAWRIMSGTMPPAGLRLGGAVYGPEFASDLEMGLRVRDGNTFLRVFAPFASRVEALFYRGPFHDGPSVRPLRAGAAGLWEARFAEDLSGSRWKLRVEQDGRTFEGLDPYSVSVTAHDGLALAGADDSPVAPGPVFGIDEAVIYELNIRDFTVDENSGVKERGKYLGLAETGTACRSRPAIRTGADHLSELGVNTVHIMPFQDFENDERAPEYNWGYMTVNFNSPEGWYATGLYNGERVREAKAMIDALHKKGIKVVMDVVYNHTAETRDKVFNFNAAAMDYYYRIREDGTYWNGSGCGNEFKSEAPMGRKFIIDSLLHWVEEYKVDGFRFDLMGLIDRGTVSEIIRRLKEVKPDIIVYGEPWAAGPTPVTGVSEGAQRSRGFAVFNGRLRDALMGSVFDVMRRGYVQSGADRAAVMRGIEGSINDFTDSPLESVNYVSCHDNHTLWDRLSLSAADASRDERVRMDKLAQAVVLTSQGVPFIHSGEEFLRTKNGEGNSYDLPDAVNRVDWELKDTNNTVFTFYRDLIAMRKAHPAFRMTSAGAVRRGLRFYEDLGLPVSEPAIAYQLEGAEAGDAWGRIVVLINPLRTALDFALPAGEYEKAFDLDGACAGGRKYRDCVGVPALSVMVLHA